MREATTTCARTTTCKTGFLSPAKHGLIPKIFVCLKSFVVSLRKLRSSAAAVGSQPRLAGGYSICMYLCQRDGRASTWKGRLNSNHVSWQTILKLNGRAPALLFLNPIKGVLGELDCQLLHFDLSKSSVEAVINCIPFFWELLDGLCSSASKTDDDM